MRSPRNFFRSTAPSVYFEKRHDGELPVRITKSTFKNVACRRLGALFSPTNRAVDVGPARTAEPPGGRTTATIPAAIFSDNTFNPADAEQGGCLTTSSTPLVAPTRFPSNEHHLCDCSVDARTVAVPSASERDEAPATEFPVSRKFASIGYASSMPFRKVKSLVQRARSRHRVLVPLRASVPPAVIPDDCWLGWDVCEAVVKGGYVPPAMESLIGQV